MDLAEWKYDFNFSPRSLDLNYMGTNVNGFLFQNRSLTNNDGIRRACSLFRFTGIIIKGEGH